MTSLEYHGLPDPYANVQIRTREELEAELELIYNALMIARRHADKIYKAMGWQKAEDSSTILMMANDIQEMINNWEDNHDN